MNPPASVPARRGAASRIGRRFVAAAPVLAAASVLALWFPGCGPPASSGGRPKVTVGVQMSPAMTLLFVAQDKGFFKDEGADVEIKEFTAGKFALQAFLGGSIDYAVPGDVPVCLAALQGNTNLRVVAQVVEKTKNEVRVVARKDDDFTDPARYFKAKKRKLATSFGGGPEFYTYNFLKRFGVGPGEVEIISQRPEDMPVALEAGGVDAISIFDPFAFIAEKKLSGRVVTFTDPELYSELYLLCASPEQVRDHPQAVEAMLRALVRAADFTRDHPDEAKAVLGANTKLAPDVIEGIWGNFDYRPALTKQLLDYWDAEAKWAKESGTAGAGASTPDFRALIDPGPLRKARPEAVLLDEPAR